jgi:hypothetical protein
MLLDLRYLVEVLSDSAWQWTTARVAQLLTSLGLVLPEMAPGSETQDLTSARGLHCRASWLNGEPVSFQLLLPIPSPPSVVPGWPEPYVQMTSVSVNGVLGTSGQSEWRVGPSILTFGVVSTSAGEAIALTVSSHGRHAA